MKAAHILSTALLVGISVASLASEANAQSSRRNATIERCMARAQAQLNAGNRTAVYKNCMVSAGQRP